MKTNQPLSRIVSKPPAVDLLAERRLIERAYEQEMRPASAVVAAQPRPESTSCWCGLARELHDGREMDAAGDMHRFGEVSRPPTARGPFEDPEPAASPKTSPALRPILEDTKKFLDLQIVRMAQNGYKYPVPTVDSARTLSKRIAAFLELE